MFMKMPCHEHTPAVVLWPLEAASNVSEETPLVIAQAQTLSSAAFTGVFLSSRPFVV
ncbi:MAG: hypothetical protein AVDCRST_MAG93-5999 [uncultured Chloroflexia bacterium]|uniref:Uncharacterized protein n=1 Tax=uncultured Chloroflexia bacterium TaxID=1672391 RepID=A0A6J4LEN5_9CHLR|nr:MAG: hypothetical protein AVDCRST_MAG93-5999 [uncultured Chloroflexia bacterium]